MNNMMIYACGGAGINVVQDISKYIGRADTGYASIDMCFIDTSRSNVHADVDNDKCYILEGLDGSGKNRKSNYQVLSESCKKILHQYQPMDLNVIVHSASGGTGSTSGPILASELLSRGANVIVLTIGSTSSRIEVENTVKTLMSYEMIAKKRNSPVVVHYRENGPDSPRGAVDTDINTILVMLAVMFSGDNKELDSSDLTNFLQYHKVTNYPPMLSMLDLHSETIEEDKDSTTVTVVTLTNEDDSAYLTTPVEYQAVGYLSPKVRDTLGVKTPIHSVVTVGYFTKVISTLNSLLAKYDEARSTVVSKPIVDAGTDHTDEGIIL